MYGWWGCDRDGLRDVCERWRRGGGAVGGRGRLRGGGVMLVGVFGGWDRGQRGRRRGIGERGLGGAGG